jgi:hypothetical protein
MLSEELARNISVYWNFFLGCAAGFAPMAFSAPECAIRAAAARQFLQRNLKRNPK